MSLVPKEYIVWVSVVEHDTQTDEYSGLQPPLTVATFQGSPDSVIQNFAFEFSARLRDAAATLPRGGDRLLDLALGRRVAVVQDPQDPQAPFRIGQKK
jgi:hypothetical protein